MAPFFFIHRSNTLVGDWKQYSSLYSLDPQRHHSNNNDNTKNATLSYSPGGCTKTTLRSVDDTTATCTTPSHSTPPPRLPQLLLHQDVKPQEYCPPFTSPLTDDVAATAAAIIATMGATFTSHSSGYHQQRRGGGRGAAAAAAALSVGLDHHPPSPHFLCPVGMMIEVPTKLFLPSSSTMSTSISSLSTSIWNDDGVEPLEEWAPGDDCYPAREEPRQFWTVQNHRHRQRFSVGVSSNNDDKRKDDDNDHIEFFCQGGDDDDESCTSSSTTTRRSEDEDKDQDDDDNDCHTNQENDDNDDIKTLYDMATRHWENRKRRSVVKDDPFNYYL
jgi:hypothetical protein